MGFMEVIKIIGDGMHEGISQPMNRNDDGSYTPQGKIYGNNNSFQEVLHNISKSVAIDFGKQPSGILSPSEKTLAQSNINQYILNGGFGGNLKNNQNIGVTSQRVNDIFTRGKSSSLFDGFNMDLTDFGLSKTKMPDVTSIFQNTVLPNPDGTINQGSLGDTTNPLMNRYVQDIVSKRVEEKNKTQLDTWLANVDGATSEFFKNSKLGVIVSGIDSKVLTDRILSSQDLIKLKSVDELNEQIFQPLSNTNWVELTVFGKNAMEYFSNPENLMNVTMFGTTPKLLQGLFTGESSTKDIAEMYAKSILMGEEPTPEFESFAASLVDMYENDKFNLGRMIYTYEYFNKNTEFLIPGAINYGLEKLSDKASKYLGGKSLMLPQDVVTDMGRYDTISDYLDKNKYLLLNNSLEHIEQQAWKYIDGFGDLAIETIDNMAQRVEDNYNKAEAFANSFGVMLNPELKNKIDGFMNKMGFSLKGQNNDVAVYLSDTIVYYIMVEIDKQKFDSNAFEHFWELNDYIDTNMPTRVLRMNFSMEEAKQLNFEKGKLDIKIQRRYAFPYTQNAYQFSAFGGAYYHNYDELIEFTAKPKIISGVATQKEIDAIKETDSAYSSRIVVEFELIPNVMYENNAGKAFNEIPKESNISTLISKAFTSCYDSGQIALTPPKNDLTLTDYALTPMTFPQLLDKLHKDFNLYDGGPNIFVDRGIFFIMNKLGPNNIKFNDVDWIYKFEIKPKNTMIDTMQTIIKPSAKSVTMSLYDEDIIFPMDRSEEQGIDSRWNQGSIIGSREKVSKNPWALGGNVETVFHDYFLKKENDNIGVYDFIIRIPNTFLCPMPCDDVEVRYKGKTYVGTIKKWAAEQHKHIRGVVLYCTSKEGKSQSTLNDGTPLGKVRNWISNQTASVQNLVSEKLGEFKDKYGIVEKANAQGKAKLEIEADNFAKVVEEYNKNRDYNSQIKNMDEAKNRLGDFGLTSPIIRPPYSTPGFGDGLTNNNNYGGFYR